MVNFTPNYSQASDAVGNTFSTVMLKDENINKAMNKLQNDLVMKIGK
jgi:hypothetical protein